MKLEEFFYHYPKAAIAFSGGVDSAYLLFAALQNKVDLCAYYVKSDFQPQFELDDAKRLAEQLCTKIKVIPLDILAAKVIADNPRDRCYYCKQKILAAIYHAAARDGYPVLFDGTNASDSEADRPGMKALRELQVLSPLQECGLTKREIRRLSKEAGLFTWNKPAYACLATRIPTGETITKEKLSAIEASEDFLFSLGFTDFRVRTMNAAAKLQFPAPQLDRVLEQRETILSELKKYYKEVTLDLEVRK